ncbi:MAG: hypothetical protein IPL55_09165 [Saprospiraceae bacterium]|nr:hypothetical protein [Saprospiraceae bacterium]
MTEKNQLIELIYEDNLVIAAEQLFEVNAIKHLIKTGSNLYIGSVKDGINYEIEIQSPFAKKQKVSCECSFYKDNKICKHIIAGLLQIRDQIKLKTTSASPKVESGASKKLLSLNTSQILEEISHSDLVAFIKSYARKDKKFTTQLKVNFARKIDLIDNADKYKSILNSIVRPNTGKESKANSSEIKALLLVLKDFSDQINDCIALGQYREGFNILDASISKLEYIRHHYAFHPDDLLKLHATYHQIIRYFLKEKLPQDLKSDMLNFLMNLASRSYYQYNDINDNVISIILSEYKNKDSLESLINTLISQRPPKEVPLLVALLLIVRGKFTSKEAEIIKLYPTLKIEIADYLVTAQHEHIALKLLESINQKKKYARDITSRLVFLYVRFNQTDKLQESGSLAYRRTGDIRFMDVLKKELTDETYQKVITKLEKELISESADPDLMIRLYKKEENWHNLLHFIAETGSLELLKRYDLLLYKHERNGLIMLYLYLISKYLDEHLGDVSFQYLEKLKQHFLIQKMSLLIEKTSDMIKEKYADRTRILDLFSN